MSALRIVTLLPLATVAAGDEANMAALARRAAARGLATSTATVNRAERMVDGDVYLLGGTGSSGTAALVALLRAVDLPGRVAAGATVLAVDAGLDALARTWAGPAGPQGPVGPQQGLGLLAMRVEPGPVVTDTVVTRAVPGLGLPPMVGWVSHAGRTLREAGVRPLADVERGAANPHLEPDGAVHGRVLGTRLHGPVLALNPELADLVLDRALPDLPAAPIPPAAQRARAERIAEVRATAAPRRGRRR